MAFLASSCRYGVFASRLLPRASVVLSQQIPNRKAAARSQRFPDYSLIYDFEKVKTASAFNRMKLQTTAFTGFVSPTALALQQIAGVISQNAVLSITFFGCAMTVFLHTFGYLFNNTVGYIYLKDDDETVKISYVGYWGQRFDIDTNIDNIQALSDDSGFFNNPWYRLIRLNDSKKTFKLYHTAGNVLDDKVFAVIFGNV